MTRVKILKMTRDELRIEAKILDIRGRGRMSKAELLTAVLAAWWPPKKKKATPRLTNHIALVIDKSGSMGHLKENVVDLVNKQIKTLKKEALLSNQKTTLTLVLFNSQRYTLYLKKPIEEVVPLRLSQYWPGSLTALYDAVGNTVRKLQRGNRVSQNVSYLVMTITDGLENASIQFNSTTFRSLLDTRQGTDLWTFAFHLPTGYRQSFLNRTGLPPGNVREWEVSEQGMETASDITSQSFSGYYQTRSTGKKSTKGFFTTDMSKITPRQVQSLKDLSPQVSEASVDQDSTIRTFCERRFGGFLKGAGFYELTKAETIQDYKKILIMEKNGSRIFGGTQARRLLKLPSHNVRVHPGDHKNYLICIQSTSVNRKLKKGTKFLYAPQLV